MLTLQPLPAPFYFYSDPTGYGGTYLMRRYFVSFGRTADGHIQPLWPMDYDVVPAGEAPESQWSHSYRTHRLHELEQELDERAATITQSINSMAITSQEEVHKCTVCLEGHTVGTSVKELTCQHRFHQACILGWIRTQLTKKTPPNCPLCRQFIEEP